MNLDLIATKDDGKRVALMRLRRDYALEMLGFWIAPNRNRTKFVPKLKSAAIY